MTPLANHFIKEFSLSALDRQPLQNPDSVDVYRVMSGCRCFEITEVLPLIEQLSEVTRKASSEEAASSAIEARSFLPAPKTWIEFKNAKGDREAYLLNSLDDQDADFFVFMRGVVVRVATLKLARFLSYDSAFEMNQAEVQLVGFTYLALAIINSPQIVSHYSREPNRGLAKRMRLSKASPFELLPWTEIKLEVSKPAEIDDGEPHQATLTGGRALHFCRAHLRVKRGRIEYVSSHWRGDPMLGIRQSRYRVR